MIRDTEKGKEVRGFVDGTLARFIPKDTEGVEEAANIASKKV